MANIRFYTNPMSRGQIARWALHEAGADYEPVILGYGTSMKDEAYLAVNPMGKVPAIVDGDTVVTECAAICAYLAERFPKADLLPRTDAERADYHRWMFFAAGPVEQAVISKSMGWETAPDKEAMVGFGNFNHVMDTLDAKLTETPYVCGDRFTMADVYLGSQVVWGTGFGTMPRRDSFIAYVERLTARAQYRAAKEIDDALIAEMKKEEAEA